MRPNRLLPSFAKASAFAKSYERDETARQAANRELVRDKVEL